MRYKLADLTTYKTPKADKMSQFPTLAQVEFEFPEQIRTVLFYHCGFVQASKRGKQDFYEVVGQLFQSDNPRETGEQPVGEIHVHVYDHPHATRFEATAERFGNFTF